MHSTAGTSDTTAQDDPTDGDAPPAPAEAAAGGPAGPRRLLAALLLVLGVVADLAGYPAVAVVPLLAAPVLWTRRRGEGTPTARPVRWLSWSVVGTSCALILAGTVDSVAGPGAAAWTRLAEVHTDLVMVVLGLAVAMVCLLAALDASRRARRLARELLVALVIQGVLGYAVYFASAPRLLTWVHLLGSVLVWTAVLRLHRELRPHTGG